MTLKEVLDKYELTPYRVAKDGGMPYPTLNIVTRGDRDWKSLSFYNLEKIAAGIGIDVISLIRQLEK